LGLHNSAVAERGPPMLEFIYQFSR